MPQTWNNWRGDSERRFQFDGAFFKATLAWGVVPFGLYYVMASGERVRLPTGVEKWAFTDVTD